MLTSIFNILYTFLLLTSISAPSASKSTATPTLPDKFGQFRIHDLEDFKHFDNIEQTGCCQICFGIFDNMEVKYFVPF